MAAGDIIEFLRGTIASAFSIGKGASLVQLKNNGGVIEARNSSDAAFVIGRGLDPVGDDDWVNKRYGDANYTPWGIYLITPTAATKYATITLALAASSTGDVVSVGPGSYAEFVTVPVGVKLRGADGPFATKITGAAATGTRVALSEGAMLEAVEVTLPSDALPAVSFAGATSAYVLRCSFVGAGALGIGISMTGAGTLFLGQAEYKSGTCAAFVSQSSGTVEASFIRLVAGVVADGLLISGGRLEYSDYQISLGATVTDGIEVGSGEVGGSGGTIRATNALHITSDTSVAKLSGLTLSGTVADLLVDPALTLGTCHLIDVRATESLLSRPSAWLASAEFIYSILDSTEGDLSIRNYAEVHTGIAENGKEIISGRGDSTSRGMVVLTSDSTATAVLDGGNLTDVSAAASSASGSTFTFQGLAANNTILVSHNLLDADTLVKLKHWGLKVKQTIATVGGTYIFERWDGAAWTGIGAMASESKDFYRYGNSLFLRASSDEHIRYGLDSSSVQAMKTISGFSGYWIRARIVVAPTTLPVFEQFKVSTPRWEANENGVNTSHGLAMWKETILSTGNIYGESGGVVNSSIAVGSGGLPTGWNHRIKNNLMNGNGDGVYIQFKVPRGTCTAFPLTFDIAYGIVGAGTDPPEMILSVVMAEISGILVADPAGGKVPVQRTEANTALLNANPAQTSTFNVPETSAGKIHNTSQGGFLIEDYYEGDNVIVRLELNNDGVDNLDVVIWEIEISGVKWTPGERL